MNLKNKPQLEKINEKKKVSRQKLYKDNFKTESTGERVNGLDWLKQKMGVKIGLKAPRG